jgi:hypothetical protein
MLDEKLSDLAVLMQIKRCGSCPPTGLQSPRFHCYGWRIGVLCARRKLGLGHTSDVLIVQFYARGSKAGA